ncbi:MAG: N-acetylneuraminate synthase family protein [Gammaproteobacteria bacterium]|nr:N-acetylneuraminate synthase family protein [Gammaproteobacteria bacterium]MCH9743467.1 N-acetylneuraminate synthase family protein [Gammaproteobacteria bacterium]
MKHAYILGAGPVGLVTAWKLLENGYKVEIYERLDRVGGMCRTWRWGDFLVDTGPHIYHTPDKCLADFWEKEFGDLFIKGDFWCKNVRGETFDEYWDYPLSWESISKFPEQLKSQVISELDSLDEEKKARATNYTEYMDAQVGPTLRKMFFETYPQKIWGITTDEMTPDWAPKRIEFRQKITPFYHNQWNAVGKYGTGCIYERIAEKIKELGGIIHLGCSVTGMDHSNNTINTIHLDNKKIINVENDIIISSLPITLTARFLGNHTPLKFRGICSIYLAYEKESILPEGVHWLYYGSDDINFNRVTEPKKLSPYVAPKDKTYITVEVTFSQGDEIDSLSEEVLITRISEQVEKVGLANKDQVIGASINKERFVYPVNYKGYQQDLTQAKATVSRYQQLYSIGTGGDYNYADSQILFHKAFDTVDILTGNNSQYTGVIRETPKSQLNPKVMFNRMVGEGHPAYIVAEGGMNHNGSLRLAKQLIDEAVRTGCDAIKFQTFLPDSRISNKVKSINYAETVIGLEETLAQIFNRLAMPFDKQKILFDYAREKGIEIFSTPFDKASVDFLETMNVNLYKIASMDLTNLPLIEYVAKTGKPMILSTGMSTLGQVEEAVNIVQKVGNSNVVLLHCNSSYPASPSEMNLNAINTLKKCFNVPVGLSDHTFGLFVAHTALAMGADVIERHFTLDRTMEGPDHILSSEPEELSELVLMAKKIPQIMGDGVKRIQGNEFETLNTQRKSLYAAVDINIGEIITEDKIVIKGPGGGLLPKYKDIIVGRKANNKVEADFPITWDVI